MAIALMIIGVLVLALGLVFLVKTHWGYEKSARPRLQKPEIIRLAVFSGVIALGALLFQVGLNVAHPEWRTDASYTTTFNAATGEYNHPTYLLRALMGYFGIFFFALANVALWLSFNIFYYKPKGDPKTRNVFKTIMFSAIPFVALFLLLYLEGIAPYLSYPVINGFMINGTGFHWTHPEDSVSGFHVAFYGIIMVSTVAVCYWICDHRFYKEFHKHGILDNLAIFAFICGVIGARIWYVVGNWTLDGFDQNPVSIFYVWNGGLTIIGGALGGIIGGVIFMMIRRKYVNVRWAMDMVVPTILLAQAIGRWGNYFNHEVYGQLVNVADGWSWLPLFIQKEMAVGTSVAGQINVPLFLIEGLINVAGYFVIAWGLAAIKKPIRSNGDLAGAYFIWYGTVRAILEPFRDVAYNMGGDSEWSVWGALVYVIIGVGLILFDHMLDLKEKNIGGNIPFVSAAAALLFAGLFTPFLTGVKKISYVSTGNVVTKSVTEPYMGFNLIFGGNGFGANVGLIIAYLLLVAALVLAIVTFVRGYKKPLEKEWKWYLLAAGLALVGVILLFCARSFLGFKEGSGTLDGHYATIIYNLGTGFMLTASLSLMAGALLVIPFIEKKRQDSLTREMKENH